MEDHINDDVGFVMSQQESSSDNGDNEDEELLHHISNYPCLFDLKSADYKNHNSKENAWKRVAENVGKSVVEVQKKFRNIRDTYRRNKRKIEAAQKSGGGQSPEIKWRLMNCCEFLDAVSHERKPLGSQENIPLPSPSSESSCLLGKKRRRSASGDGEMSEIIKTMQAAQASLEVTSEDDLFGQSVGLTLARMSRRKAAKLKLDICQLIYETEEDI